MVNNNDDDMLVLDTRKATKAHKFALIVDDGSREGKQIEFTVRPLDSDAYLTLTRKSQELQSLSGKTGAEFDKAYESAEKMFEKMLIPLISPNDEFRQWANDTLANGAEMAYRQVMDNIIAISVPDMSVKKEG